MAEKLESLSPYKIVSEPFKDRGKEFPAPVSIPAELAEEAASDSDTNVSSNDVCKPTCIDSQSQGHLGGICVSAGLVLR